MHELPYNRDAVVAYARKWAMSRNPAYYNFENVGGDCTNFASQCIYAGAQTMNFTPVTGWYYKSSYDRTASWSGVEYLYKFLVKNESIGPFARIVPQNGVMPGDIVQLGTRDGHFYHSPVVITVRPEILVAAHSDDSLNRPLSTYDFDIVRFLHIEGVRTP